MIKINDFGEKIGGARKDLWKTRGLTWQDAVNMTAAEKEEYIKRDQIWPKLNIKEEIDKGVPLFLLYWKNEIRKCIYPSPGCPENRKQYIDGVQKLKAMVQKVKDEEDIPSFRELALGGYVLIKNKTYPFQYDYTSEFQGVIKGNTFLRCLNDLAKMKRKMKRIGFGEANTKKKNTKKKKSWVPPQLQNIQRSGVDFRKGKNISGTHLIDAFGIRAGEFGNWTNVSDRTWSLNMAFDAFMDLANALQISRLDIGLPGLQHGALAIAFGARGIGNAVAHYEPFREVINITKMRGAGSLAHEWGHALDDYIGKCIGLNGLASNSFTASNMHKMPESFVRLNKAFFADECTSYYENAKKINSFTSKEGHGYWNSRCEMFARAFACYVKDRCLPIRNDYLYGHADSCWVQGIPAFPQGEERHFLNLLFDELFIELKAKGMLHDPTEEFQCFPAVHFYEINSVNNISFDFQEQEDGQLSLF